MYFERAFLFSSNCGRKANSGYGMYVKQFEILQTAWKRPIISNNLQMLQKSSIFSNLNLCNSWLKPNYWDMKTCHWRTSLHSLQSQKFPAVYCQQINMTMAVLKVICMNFLLYWHAYFLALQRQGYFGKRVLSSLVPRLQFISQLHTYDSFMNIGS